MQIIVERSLQIIAEICKLSLREACRLLLRSNVIHTQYESASRPTPSQPASDPRRLRWRERVTIGGRRGRHRRRFASSLQPWKVSKSIEVQKWNGWSNPKILSKEISEGVNRLRENRRESVCIAIMKISTSTRGSLPPGRQGRPHSATTTTTTTTTT